MDTRLDVESTNKQFLQKIEYENEKIKTLMLSTSKANIYAASKEIYLKKHIRNTLVFAFENYNEEDKLILLSISDIIEHVYSCVKDKENKEISYNNLNQNNLLFEVIKEIIKKEGVKVGKLL